MARTARGGTATSIARRGTEAGNGSSSKLQDALYRIADMASGASDMGEFYAAMHRTVGELMFANNFYIALYDEERGLLNYPYYRDEVDEDVPDPEAWEPMGTGQARGLTAYVLRTGTPQLIDYANFRDLVGAGEIDEIGVWNAEIHWLGVPLRAEGRSIGVVVVQSYEGTHRYSEQDRDLLTFVGQHIASALSRARAIAETKRLLAESSQREAELAIINSVQAGLAERLETQAMYDLVGDKIQEIFDAQVVDIGVVDRSVGLIRFPYTIERGVRFPDEPIPVMGIRRHVLETREPLLINERAAERAAELGQAAAIQGEVPKSSLFVPLLTAGEAWGVISLQNIDREFAFSDADVSLLSTLAASLSVALENVRLVDEMRQRVAELGTINSVGQALSAQLDLDALIELVGDKMRETFNADIVYVAMLDQERGMIDFPYHVEGDQREAPTPLKLGEGLTSRILQTREPLLLNSDVQRPSFGPVVGTPARSFLGVPILARDEAIGAIAVQSTREEGRFNEADARLLATIAAGVGAAIQNAELYEETRRRGSEMAALAQVGRQISATLDASEVLLQIAERARDLLDGSASAVYLANEDGRSFQATVAVGVQAGEIRASQIQLGEGIIGDLAQRGAAEMINDVQRDPRAILIPGTTDEPNERLIVAPLLAGEKVIGMMAVWRAQESEPFVQENLDFLVGLSQQAAVAIANARLYAAAQEARAEADRHRLELARFLPSTVAELMTSPDGQGLLSAHRREISAIYCDLRGFTAFTQMAEPEEVFDLLAAYQREIGQLVLDNGGTLEHYAGDAIFGFLNDPKPVAGHPLVAVSMALEMQARFGRIAEGWARRGFELGLGIGISTGYATVGRVGFEGYYLYAAIGSVANLCSRLCAMAKPGQVVISGRSYELVESAVEAEPLGSVELKGFSRPVEAFSVAGLKAKG